MPVEHWVKSKEWTPYITELAEDAWRLENQDVTSLRKLVDSLDEQAILEELIETTKPELYIPFRNPPLKYGSRFGKRLEPSLWYGSFESDTAMAEKAFYTFNFLRASAAAKEIELEIPLILYASHIKTSRAVNLVQPPFVEYAHIISSPVSYKASQELGSALRNDNIEALAFQSARDPRRGTNLALFTPKAIVNKKPKTFQSWSCLANENLVEFVRADTLSHESRSFTLQLFLINQQLPFPAN